MVSPSLNIKNEALDAPIRVLDKTFLTNNYKMATWDENLKKKLLSG
jgi:hypothetical protein